MLLYHRSTCVTGRRLAKLLGLVSGNEARNRTVVIRWGSSVPVMYDKAINTQRAIQLAANGLESLVQLRDIGIPTLKVFKPAPANPADYPILGRRVYHRAGKDIIWCENQKDAEDSGRLFFTKYQRVDKELRIHVFGGDTLRVFRKVPRTTNAHPIIRTSLRGWGYVRVNHTEYYHKAQEIGIHSLDALGLDFGAVDLGWNEEERKYYVFEVNSAPGLNSISLLYYGQKLEEYLLSLEGEYVPTGFHWASKINNALISNNDAE